MPTGEGQPAPPHPAALTQLEPPQIRTVNLGNVEKETQLSGTGSTSEENLLLKPLITIYLLHICSIFLVCVLSHV